MRARDYAALAVVVEQSRALGKVLFFPASIVTVVSGVVLVATEDWLAFGDLWILVGFGGIVVSPVIQMTIAERARERFTSLVEAGRSTGVLAGARALTLVNVIDLVVLLVVVWAMFAEPTL